MQALKPLLSKLEGWKTILGLTLLNLDARMDLPDKWWVHLILAVGLALTGYGLGDKVYRKKKNGTKQT